MELEVILNGKGSITIKAEVEWSQKAIRKATEHAVGLIQSTTRAKEPYGFEGGASVHLSHGPGSEADPKEMGWVER